jgi:hypothetical protein
MRPNRFQTSAPDVNPALPHPVASGESLVLTVFYGYPVEVLAGWCRVSRVTARLYKSGVRSPSKPVLRLFTLHRDARVLGPEWDGWRVVGPNLVNPAGESFTAGRLTAYRLIYQLASELASRDPQTKGRFYELLRTG